MFCFKPKLKKHGMYAIHSGELQGGFFVWIDKYDQPGHFALFFMPDPMEAMLIRKDEIREMLSANNLRFIEKLPDAIYQVCELNFKYYAEQQKLAIAGAELK